MRTNTRVAVATAAAAGFAAGAVFAASTAEASPVEFDRYVSVVTGVDPAEDDPAFDCRLHGNRICGPGNSQGVSQRCSAAPCLLRGHV